MFHQASYEFSISLRMAVLSGMVWVFYQAWYGCPIRYGVDVLSGLVWLFYQAWCGCYINFELEFLSAQHCYILFRFFVVVVVVGFFCLFLFLLFNQ